MTSTLLLAAAGAEGAAHSPPLDAFALGLVLLAAWAAGGLATRFGYPAVLGELLAGILLGPPVLGVLSDGAGLAAIAELGIVLMMVYIGTEIDFDHLRRASRAGVLAAIGGFVVPFAGGFAVTLLFGFDVIAAVFVGAAVGVTSLATKSRILADLGLFDTRIAYVLVAGALLSDTATLLLFAGVTSIGTGAGIGSLGLVAVDALLFGAVMGAAAWLAPRFGSWTRGRFDLEGPTWGLGVLIVGGLGGAAVAEFFGLHSILGAFVAGMVLRRGVLTGRTERRSVELLGRLSVGVLAPVFFTTAGFAISLEAMTENIGLLLAVLAVATFGKILGTALFYLPTGHGWREGLVVGGAMNGRGAVEIVVAGIGLEQGLITTEIFTVLVVMAIVTTATVPVLLKVGVEWLRGRGELVDADESRRGVTIIGAGPVARALASTLSRDRDVWLVDTNVDRVHLARAQGLRAIVGDGLDPDVLRQAHADEACVVVALTANLQTNLLVADVARDELGVRDIRVALGPGAHPSSVGMLERSGARPLGDSPVDVERWGAWLVQGEATISTVVVHDLPRLAEIEAHLSDHDHVLPLAVRRASDTIPFTILDRLRVEDQLVVLVRRDHDARELEVSSGTVANGSGHHVAERAGSRSATVRTASVESTSAE